MKKRYLEAPESELGGSGEPRVSGAQHRHLLLLRHPQLVSNSAEKLGSNCLWTVREK